MDGKEGANAVPIPEAVKEQGKRAEEIHRQMYPDQYPQKDGEKPKEDAGKTPEAPKTDPNAPVEKPREESAKPAEPARELPNAPAPEDWKQKYEVLQGKYNAEVPALHMNVAGLQNQIKEQNAKIRELQQAPAPPVEKKPEEKPKAEAAEDPVVKSLKEDYPDIYEAMVKMIGASKPAEAKPAEKPAADVKPGSEPKPAAETAPIVPRETFNFYLERDVPDWQTVNREKEFIAALMVPDPRFSGMTKLQALQSAYEACDFTTVIGYFRDYKDFKARQAAAPPAKPELTPEERKLAPSTGSRGPASPGPTTPAVTRDELKKFYEDARKGLWGDTNGEKFKTEERRLLNPLTKPKT